MSNYAHLSQPELVRLLEARDRRDATRFGLVWEADEIERDLALNSDFVALDLDPALSVGPGPWENLIIEGDNFDALRNLRMCYAGRVKCIYIDPPYNTGNRDFVYNDRFMDANDAWRHSTWCEFMYQRLTLAKDLLRQDGVIFVSIDDNEIHALGLLMQRIFGEANFVANVIWEKRYSPQNAAKWFSESHDFIMVYAREKEHWFPNLLQRTEEMNARYRNLDNDERGVWKPADSTAQAGHGTESQFYILTAPNGKKHHLPNGRCWVYTEEVMKKMIFENRVWFGATGNNVPAIKRFMSEVKQGVVAKTIWNYQEVGHNQEGKKEILQLLPDSATPFDTPKPTRLIERILRLATNPGDLVLDFFAGSGTTAHAVMKLNAEDNGNRRYILVSNTEATASEPAKNLCRDVCAQRVRRVIEGYGDTPGLGGNFAYLRCRRISPENLAGIEHAQVWHALQLLHTGTLVPYDASREFQWAKDGREAIAYLPRFSAKLLPALRAALRTAETATLYSWQLSLFRQHLRSHRIHHLPIPEHLALKFGLRK